MFLLNPGEWEAKSTNWTENQKNLWVQPTLPELQIISTYLQCNSSCLRDYFKSRWHIFRLSKLRRRGIRDWGQKLPKTWYQWEKLGKKRDKCTEAFQRSFLFVAQSSFLAAGFLDSAKAQSFLGWGGIISKGQELCLGEWACQSCEVTWLCGLLRKPGVQRAIVLDMNCGTPIPVLLACV